MNARIKALWDARSSTRSRTRTQTRTRTRTTPKLAHARETMRIYALYIDRFFWVVTESGLKKINPNQTLGVFFMTDITALVMVPPSFFRILKPVEPD